MLNNCKSYIFYLFVICSGHTGLFGMMALQDWLLSPEKTRLKSRIKEGFFQAIRNDDVDLVSRALQKNSKLAKICSREGIEPLHEACNIISNLEIIKLLIKFGANVNCQCFDYGNTPLHMVCQGEEVEVAEYLLCHGAKVDTENDYGYTPLHYAYINSHGPLKAMVKLLLAHGAHSKKDIHGRNPKELFEVLKKHGVYSVDW